MEWFRVIAFPRKKLFRLWILGDGSMKVVDGELCTKGQKEIFILYIVYVCNGEMFCILSLEGRNDGQWKIIAEFLLFSEV